MIIPIDFSGNSATKNSETRAAPTVPGFFQNESQQQQFNEENKLLQELGDNSHFQRLEKAFRAKGWGLLQLSDDTLMVTMPKWGMSRTLPDLRAAQILLRQIGGAT